MQNEMNLMRQMVDVLVQSATHKKDYGRELETLDDVASVLNTLRMQYRQEITNHWECIEGRKV